jgi:hypothetical protein
MIYLKKKIDEIKEKMERDSLNIKEHFNDNQALRIEIKNNGMTDEKCSNFQKIYISQKLNLNFINN